MSGLWRWLAAAAGTVAGFLLVWMQIIAGQRNRAREDADRQRQRADTSQARRETERRVSEAQRQAREKATEVARDEDARRSAGDRSGGLGNDRLRD